MTTGTITRRGQTSWRLKYDLERDPDGQRRIFYKTVRGKRADAERELRALLHQRDNGVAIDPSKVTVAEYLKYWLDEVAPETVGPKSLERYRGLARNQIVPHLGSIGLQELKPKRVKAWHRELRTTNLSPRSIRHAHGVLRTALNNAVSDEVVVRNVATHAKLPKLTRKKVTILTADQIADTLAKLEGHSIYPIVAMAIGTGARRGEILALCWSDIDLDGATVHIERALEQTAAGIRCKAPKTEAGVRLLSLPEFAIAALRDHRRQQLELRMALGMGALPTDAPVFGDLDGKWPNPYSLSDRWRDLVKSRKLPKVTFHALRHTHASVLIDAGLDVVKIATRLGHENPSMTLDIYAHLFEKNDKDAAEAIDRAFAK